MHAGGRLVAGDPHRFPASKADFVVGRHRELERHVRPAVLHAANVPGMRAPGLLGADADLDHDPRFGHAPMAGARHLRIGIDQRRDDAER